MSSSTSEMGLTAPDDGNAGLKAVTIDCGCLTWTCLDLAKRPSRFSAEVVSSGALSPWFSCILHANLLFAGLTTPDEVNLG